MTFRGSPLVEDGGVPLMPDRGQARDWLVRELSGKEYQDARPGPLQDFLAQLWRAFEDFLASLNGIDPALGPLVLVLAGAVVVGLLIFFLRPRPNAHGGSAEAVFGPQELSADEHRRLARAAAGRAEWAPAVTEQFRALVRAGEERVVLDPRPVRTAEEAANQLGAAFPDRLEALHRCAALFNGIRYGNIPATAADYDAVERLDAQLRRSAPQRRAAPPAPLAVPR